MLGEYKIFIFGDYGNNVSIKSQSLEYAVKLFKLEELWPEKYIGKKWRKKDEKERYYVKVEKGGEEVFEGIEGAKIPVYERKDDRKDKKVLELDLIDCINVNYNIMEGEKYLPPPDAVGIEEKDKNEEENEEEIKEMEIYEKVKGEMTNKQKARERMIDIERMKKELQKKMDELEMEVEKFEEIIERKKKQLFAIETYLGMYEEVWELRKGNPAKEEEKIAVYQQKCYMDEEMGLTEADGYYYKQGIDYNDIDKFDKWITRNYKKYIYKEKGIMAWEVRRTDKKYSNDWNDNRIENLNNHRTYLLMRNGDNLYRIYSGVGTPERLYPSLKEIEEKMKEGRESDYKNFVEQRIYIYIALQGIIDRTDIFGNNFRGKVNFVSPNMVIEKYIDFVRDAEYEFYLSDGKKTWDEYISDNRDTIEIGKRVLRSDERVYFDDDYRQKAKHNALEKMNGVVCIVEDERKSNSRNIVRKVMEKWEIMINIMKKYDGVKVVNDLKNDKEEEAKLWEMNNEFDKEKIPVYAMYDNETKSRTDKKGHWTNQKYKGISMFCDGHTLNLNDNDDESWNIFGNTVKNGRVKMEKVIEGLERKKKYLEEWIVQKNYDDKYKIYGKAEGTVYKGWGDYEGHERKVRKGFWINRWKLINIDEVKVEDIKYYLNNRLYRKDYIELFSFLKFVYMYKRAERDSETDFVKLVMSKSGCDDEEKVRELMTWWKIKNKWRRFLRTDENKAYRMIMRRLKNKGEEIEDEEEEEEKEEPIKKENKKRKKIKEKKIVCVQ